MKDSLFVNEIFGSIDGEGIRTGELATFIRLAGCNLRCRYCDTTYSLKACDGVKTGIDDIIDKCKEIGYKNITLTGGEPLLQNNVYILIDKLIKNSFKVNIETSGSIDISKLLDTSVIITLDYKTLSSGMNNKMILENFSKLREQDVLKFVCNRNDLDNIKEFIKNNDIKSYIYFSPIFNEIEPSELVDFKRITYIRL